MKRRIALLTSIGIIFGILSITLCASAQNAQTNDSILEKPISISFKDVPVRNAIEQLFQGTGLSYAFEPGVQGTVTLNLVDVPFNDALTAILKAANLTVRKERGIYTIGPIREITTFEPSTAAIEIPEIEKPKMLEKIQIGYADVYDIANIFGVDVIESRASDLSGLDVGGEGGTGGSDYGGDTDTGNTGRTSGGTSRSSGRSSGTSSFGSSRSSGSSIGTGITMPR